VAGPAAPPDPPPHPTADDSGQRHWEETDMPPTNPATPDRHPNRPDPDTASTGGPVPTADEQTADEQFVTLAHTPDLRVPHNRLAVSSLRQMPTHNGVAFVADLTIDGRYAGPIENDGNGGPTTYFGLNSSPFTWRHLHEYVQACRYRGRPVSEEFVLDALVTEFDLGQQVKAAAAAGATLVRLLDANGHTLDIQAVRPAPTTPAERAAIARLAARPPSYPQGRLWQISWVPEGSVSWGETPCHIETG